MPEPTRRRPPGTHGQNGAETATPRANGFLSSGDRVQARYEMLRAHRVDGLSVAEAARAHGYSRAAFYVVARAFDEAGMMGLVDAKRGPRGPYKLSPDIREFIAAAPDGVSGAELARQIAARFGIRLHRRTVERARRR